MKTCFDSLIRSRNRHMMHSAEVPEETAMEILDSLSVVLLAVPGMAHLTQAPGSHGYKELGFLS